MLEIRNPASSSFEMKIRVGGRRQEGPQPRLHLGEQLHHQLEHGGHPSASPITTCDRSKALQTPMRPLRRSYPAVALFPYNSRQHDNGFCIPAISTSLFATRVARASLCPPLYMARTHNSHCTKMVSATGETKSTYVYRDSSCLPSAT